MSDEKSFMDLAVAGKVRPEEIDDYVDDWHAAPVGELHNFLGLDWSEYAQWASDASKIDRIIEVRRERRETKAAAEL